MNCREFRDHVTARPSTGGGPPSLDAHRASCADCRAYAERLDRTRAFLRDHHLAVEPDAAFAARVTSRLPSGPLEQMGPLALRLLPATLVLVALLAWFAAGSRIDPVAADDVADDELLSWILDDGGAP